MTLLLNHKPNKKIKTLKEGFNMKNTFYRPELKRGKAIEMQGIVDKLKSDFYEIDNASEDEVTEYVKRLIEQGKPLKNNSKMVFWGLDEPENMPSDARVDFFYMPTYYASAIMAAGVTKYKSLWNIPGFKECLGKGLNACTGRNFMGSGYGDMNSFLDTLEIFARAGMKILTEKYPDLSPEFTEKLNWALGFVKNTIISGDAVDPWSGRDFSARGIEVEMMFEKAA